MFLLTLMSAALQSATKSVESTDSGTVYTLNRAAGIVVTLPTAAAGLKLHFYSRHNLYRCRTN